METNGNKKIEKSLININRNKGKNPFDSTNQLDLWSFSNNSLKSKTSQNSNNIQAEINYIKNEFERTKNLMFNPDGNRLNKIC